MNQRRRFLPWWAVVPALAILPLLGMILLLRRKRARLPGTDVLLAIDEGPSTDGEPLETAVPPDDLTVLEGVGPKIQSVLNAAGIFTYRRLASTSAEELRRVLLNAGLRLADPATWPEQAGLLAAADFAAFQALTAQLKAGRRVKKTQD